MQKNKNEVNSPKFEIRPASSAEAGLFYAQHPAEDQQLGCIGHVRMDFGKSGNEFWHTWWPRGPEELNSPKFKTELQEVVDELRLTVLKSRFSKGVSEPLTFSNLKREEGYMMAERVCCSYQNALSKEGLQKELVRVACLYRVSTTKQVDHDERNQADIPVQRKSCHDFCDRMGWTIVMEEQENGVSGFKVSANDRDKLQTLKESAEQGKFDVLLVFMFDRIGRRAEETPFVVEWFVNHGIQVWSVNEGEQKIDTHVDRLTNYIRFWQADGESQKTSMRTKAALGQMVQDGRFRGGIAPYGYRLVPSGVFNKRKHEVFKLEIDEDEAKVVRMMFDLCLGSGYGRFKIANFLSEMGIKTRDGKNWHEATVGHILHNIIYIGVLRSGTTQSEIFPDLQIITPENFELAQKLMAERANECNALRTMPRNTRGQSLLSGNVFCGHCGGRLTLTTNGTVRINAAGERIGRKRIRYVCYNKTRKRNDCDGQTGYTMHILDKLVSDVLHEVFNRMRSVEESEIVSRTHRSAMVSLKERLTTAKNECAKATKEYESLKLEIIKAVQGESAFPMEILSELVNNARTKMLEADAQLSELNEEFEKSNQRIDQIKSDYRRLLQWSEMFDSSDISECEILPDGTRKLHKLYDYDITENRLEGDRFIIEGSHRKCEEMSAGLQRRFIENGMPRSELEQFLQRTEVNT